MALPQQVSLSRSGPIPRPSRSGDVPAGEHDQKKAGRAAQIEMTLRGRFGEAVKGDEKAFEYISQAVLHMSSAEDRLILMAVAQNMFAFGAASYATGRTIPRTSTTL